MKQWYAKINVYYKVCIWSIISVSVIVCATSPLFFLGYQDIPQGIILGAFVSILAFFILAIIDKKELENKKSIGVILINIFRFVVLASVLFLSGWLFYQKNIHLFNIFAITGSYFIPLIWLIILNRKENKCH